MGTVSLSAVVAEGKYEVTGQREAVRQWNGIR